MYLLFLYTYQLEGKTLMNSKKVAQVKQQLEHMTLEEVEAVLDTATVLLDALYDRRYGSPDSEYSAYDPCAEQPVTYDIETRPGGYHDCLDVIVVPHAKDCLCTYCTSHIRQAP
jgi:hypothetical protein